jgi:hypothetical protein
VAKGYQGTGRIVNSKRNQSQVDEKQLDALEEGQGGRIYEFRTFLRHNSIAGQIQGLLSVI